ncbi:penicillin-binding transpeptidase domain-containing protein [Streptomyces sp. DSM 41982]|uniref:Penicillin-binding transpeptidase domain-containing protein n=1 Tax=Streptomyces evansiae TaxID=3075535 RepID=A0ABD5E864_9ACTN|nr:MULTISPECIES: penicillin-binding transpeptidase domain-containing protein [unclassified Streptomyces]MDT0417263.1 penicillin-binding transpeptidase domain-containing protein [Streptomyces sp. DSM 41982]SCE33984.1 Cell division protein FtsI/penicillin-binding protein 2 [Streptomyces sp. SolWspMP-sol7th]
MNRTIRNTSVFVLLLVLALLARATWVQFYEAPALSSDEDNHRTVMARYADPLGDIVVGGSAVTGSRETDSGDLRYARTYEDGPLYAPVTGYTSQVYGQTMLEGVYKDLLDGSDTRLQSPVDALTRSRAKPGDVVTTIDPAVQKAGYEALGNKKGAALALDPATGRILGMVSTPSYDPSKITGSDDGAAWKALLADPDKPTVNRALRQPLPPGSTFKLVVAAAALEDGLYASVDARTDSPDPYHLPLSTKDLTNESASAPCENASIRVALQYSCNTVFGKMAADLGQDKVRAMAEKFGFNTDDQDVPVRAYPSVYPKGMDKAQTALSGIGQFDVTATPLQMAEVSAALANGGQLATPYLVDRTTNGDGDVLSTHGDTRTTRIVSADTARQLRSAMETVVAKGTGTNAAIPGATVGAKTGTAQHGENNSATPYAWFTSYAKGADGKQVAVAVMVEDSDAARAEVSGNGLAGPVAKAMMTAALGKGAGSA